MAGIQHLLNKLSLSLIYLQNCIGMVIFMTFVNNISCFDQLYEFIFNQDTTLVLLALLISAALHVCLRV